MYAPLDLRLVAIRFGAIPPEEYPLSASSRRSFFLHQESPKATFAALALSSPWPFFVVVVAVAFLSVIPSGNLLLPLLLPIWLSFRTPNSPMGKPLAFPPP
jgi:hypothetical protein